MCTTFCTTISTPHFNFKTYVGVNRGGTATATATAWNSAAACAVASSLARAFARRCSPLSARLSFPELVEESRSLLLVPVLSLYMCFVCVIFVMEFRTDRSTNTGYISSHQSTLDHSAGEEMYRKALLLCLCFEFWGGGNRKQRRGAKHD